jgi:quercetin dioxygenase-like cupin family protein
MPEQTKCFYQGNFRDDARKGVNNWVVGAFDTLQPPRRTELVEIKYWDYKKGEPNHDPKTSCTIECTLILKGRIRGMVGDGDIELSAGEYVMIAPGTPNALPREVLEDVEGLTIKAPSITVAKHLLKGKSSDEVWLGEIKRCDP